MTDPLSKLIEFHRVASELAATRDQLAGVPEEMRSLHEEYVEARSALDALEAEAERARTERRQAEAAIADAQERLRKFQHQVPMVRNQREYAALLTEIDTAKAEIKRLEEAALESLDSAERIGSEVQERQSGFAEVKARYDEQLAAWEARKPEVARRADELAHAADQLRGELPRPIVAQYQRIAGRYEGAALSPLRRADTPGTTTVWFCSTCNYQIRPQVAVEIRSRGTIVQCEGCKRFLFVEDED
jgi:predicted  nucleic acid-binding Zn-ribbon protein